MWIRRKVLYNLIAFCERRRSLEKNGKRPVVCQRHLHVRPENAVLHLGGLLPAQRDKILIEFLCRRRRGGGREAGAVAAAGVGAERKLGDD